MRAMIKVWKGLSFPRRAPKDMRQAADVKPASRILNKTYLKKPFFNEQVNQLHH